MIPGGHYMVRTDSIRTPPPPKKPAPPPAPTAPEEDKDSSTGHEGDDSEDAGTAAKGKGPTPDSKRRSSRGDVDEDDVRRSKRPHRRSEDVEAIIQAEHPGRGTPRVAKKGNTPGVHIRMRSGECKCGFCDKIAKTETGLKKHVTSAHLDKRENWIIEDEVVVAPAAGAGRGGGRGGRGGRGRGRGRGGRGGAGRSRRGGRGGRGGRQARASAVDAAGEVETESEGGGGGVSDMDDDDDNLFEMRAALTGSRGTRGRSDKDATAVSSSDDEDDDDEGQQTGKRPTPGGVARFAAITAAADEDGDGDSEANYNQAVEFNANARKRGAAGIGGVAKRAKTEYRNRCPICAFNFKGPQGMPGHYMNHHKTGATQEEKDRGIELWEEFKRLSRERREAAKQGKGPSPAPPARAAGGARKPVAPPYRETTTPSSPSSSRRRRRRAPTARRDSAAARSSSSTCGRRTAFARCPRPRTRSRTCTRTEGTGWTAGPSRRASTRGPWRSPWCPTAALAGCLRCPRPPPGSSPTARRCRWATASATTSFRTFTSASRCSSRRISRRGSRLLSWTRGARL